VPVAIAAREKQRALGSTKRRREDMRRCPQAEIVVNRDSVFLPRLTAADAYSVRGGGGRSLACSVAPRCSRELARGPANRQQRLIGAQRHRRRARIGGEALALTVVVGTLASGAGIGWLAGSRHCRWDRASFRPHGTCESRESRQKKVPAPDGPRFMSSPEVGDDAHPGGRAAARAACARVEHHALAVGVHSLKTLQLPGSLSNDATTRPTRASAGATVRLNVLVGHGVLGLSTTSVPGTPMGTPDRAGCGRCRCHQRQIAPRQVHQGGARRVAVVGEGDAPRRATSCTKCSLERSGCARRRVPRWQSARVMPSSPSVSESM